jgi:hypothetical protein
MKNVSKTLFSTSEEEKLDRIIEKSKRIILKISTVFPFDFFPNDIIVSENQIDVVIREFFFSEHIETVLLSQIEQVSVETSLLFGSLTISILKPQSVSIVIPYFWRADAILARRIVYGLMAAAKEKIDISELDTTTLVKKLEKIGMAYQ